VYLILLGAPGAGKGTQAAYVAQKLNLVHLATGDLFRQAMEQKTELGIKAQSYLESGQLVPDEVTIGMVLERLAELSSEAGVVFDGFPRNLKQAESLDRSLAEQKRAVDKVVYIKVSEEELLRRLSGRWICRNCQMPYHAVDSPPQVEGRCDRCGGELYQRADDNVDTIKKRLGVYFSETAPLIDYYAASGRLLEIAGEGSVSEVGERIITALKKEFATG